VRVAAKLEKETLLTVAESYAPGWTGTLDGAPLTIETTSLGFMQMKLSAGEHKVTLAYRAPGFRSGAAVTAATLLALLLVGLWRKLKRGS
jgi:uncharacterized membrane protein YfhO